MDPVRFDTIVKTLSAPGTRRGALGGLLAGTLSLLGLSESAARKRRGRHRPRRRDDAKAPDKKRRKASTEGPCGNGGSKANECRKDKDCCTGNCDKKKGRCRCKKLGEGCAEDRNCCASFGQPMTCQSGSCQTVQAPAPPPPGCTPTTCAAQGKNCGSISDGCGGTLTCGSCGNSTPVCVNNVCAACSAHSQCASNQVCDGGACQTCTVTCPSGNPTTCGNALQAAVIAAAPGATLYVCPGTYKSPPNTDPFTLSDRGFLIEGAGKTITIIGAGQDGEEATNTILDANPGGTTDGRRVMTINSGVAEVTLERLRITGGAGVTAGGGIFNDSGGTLRLTACTVAANQASLQGGGIFNNTNCSLLMTDCSLAGNHVTGGMATGGGGIETGGEMTLTTCTLSGNTSTNAGGGISINADGRTITLDATVIGPGNTANSVGGGIDNLRGTLNLVDGSEVTGNHAGTPNGGGGIFNTPGEGVLTISGDSSVTGNTAGDPSAPNNCAGAPPASGICGP